MRSTDNLNLKLFDNKFTLLESGEEDECNLKMELKVEVFHGNPK